MHVRVVDATLEERSQIARHPGTLAVHRGVGVQHLLRVPVLQHVRVELVDELVHGSFALRRPRLDRAQVLFGEVVERDSVEDALIGYRDLSAAIALLEALGCGLGRRVLLPEE